MSVFQDDDGDRTAYLISTTGDEQQHLTIYRLKPTTAKTSELGLCRMGR
ncbi:hypothetical protein [Sorangium sp. So ce861]